MLSDNNIVRWTVTDVQNCLIGRDWVDTYLLRKLSTHEVDGAALLELTKHDLREDFGIKELGKIKRILRKLSALKRIQKPICYEEEEEEETQPDLQCDDDISEADMIGIRSVNGRGSFVVQPPPRPAPPSPTPLAAAPPPADDLQVADLCDVDIIEIEDLIPDQNRSRQERSSSIPPRPVTAIGHRPLNGMDDLKSGHRHVWADDPAVHITRASDLLGDDTSEELTPEAIKQLTSQPQLRNAWLSNSVERPVPIPRPPVSEGPPGQRLPNGHRTPDWVHTPWKPPGSNCSQSKGLSLMKISNPHHYQIDLNAPAYENGILEQERRYSDLQLLFTLWVTEGHQEAERHISFKSICDVLKAFCGWTNEESVSNSTVIMNEIDSNSDGQLDWHEFFVFMTRLSRAMPPTAFDSFIGFFEECIKGVNQRDEESRRSTILRRLFTCIDDDCSGSISELELRNVITHIREIDGCEISEMIKDVDTGGEASDGALQEEEFVFMMRKMCGDCAASEFDLMIFRLEQAIYVMNETAPNSATIKSVTADDLEMIVSLSPSSSPLILSGRGPDPTQAISGCAAACGVSLRPLFVASDKSASAALRTLTRSGFSKGEWICIIVEPDYHDSDPFLRELGIKIQTESPWDMHRKFRLWICTPTCKYYLPSILSVRSAVCIYLNF